MTPRTTTYFMMSILLSFISIIHSLSDQVTAWNLASFQIPFADHSQAVGYDTHTGIIHLIGGSCAGCQTHYSTFNTKTESISTLQYLSNNGHAPEEPYARFYIQINRTVYMYNHNSRCIDTFNMASSTFTSCWSSIATLIPSDSLKGCLSIDDTARYFYVIPETNSFFFYDSVESRWYLGPSTIQSAHLYVGCDVIDDRLFYWGGQKSWDSEEALTAMESIDISDMDALKRNSTSISWRIQNDFLPSEHDFVRNIRFNDGTIYSIGGNRFETNANYIDVLALDLTTNEVKQSVNIASYVIGGSLLFDPCHRCLYYFGGFNGSIAVDTVYVSNKIDNVLPSKYNMQCMLSKEDKYDPFIIEIIVIVLVVWIVICVGCIIFTSKKRNATFRDDKEASLSGDIRKMPDFTLKMGIPSNTVPLTKLTKVPSSSFIMGRFVEGNDLWDPKMMGMRINLQTDLKTVVVEKGFVWATACMKREVDVGVHSWTFEVQEYHGEKGVNGWNLMIGIWKKYKISRKHIDYFYCTEPGAGYAYVASDGVLTDPLKGAVAGRSYGAVLNEGNTPYIIEMIVNLDDRTVSYLINGKDFGVAFSNIEDTMYAAAISFMPQMGRQQLKFISYKSRLKL